MMFLNLKKTNKNIYIHITLNNKIILEVSTKEVHLEKNLYRKTNESALNILASLLIKRIKELGIEECKLTVYNKQLTSLIKEHIRLV